MGLTAGVEGEDHPWRKAEGTAEVWHLNMFGVYSLKLIDIDRLIARFYPKFVEHEDFCPSKSRLQELALIAFARQKLAAVATAACIFKDRGELRPPEVDYPGID